MAATKTRPTDLASRLEDAETTAAQLRAALAEEEAKRQEEARAAQARRQAADDQWWIQRRATYSDRSRGRVDSAWQAFADAVRDGGDTVQAWREWRTTARIVRSDFLAIRAHFFTKDQERAQADLDTFRAIHAEGYELADLAKQAPADRDQADYAARLKAYNEAAARWQGETIKPDAPAAPYRLRQPPRVPQGQIAWISEADRFEADMLSYSDALEVVMRDLDRKTLAHAEAERQADRDTHAAKAGA